MQIQAISNSQNNIKSQSFTGLPAKFTQQMTNLKVFNKATGLDFVSFQEYALAKAYKMGITADEIAQLSKFEGIDFIQNSYGFLAKKLGLTGDIIPALRIAELPGDPIFGYAPHLNGIYLDINKMNSVNPTKTNIFAALRHELEHFLQNTMVLRHETLGIEAIEKQAKTYVNVTKQGAMQTAANFSVEQLRQAGMSEDVLTFFEKLKSCMNNNDTESINKMFEADAIQHREYLTALRNELINKMGLIKKDSALTPKIRQYSNELNGIQYYNADASVNYGKYFSAITEENALHAQTQAELEFSQSPCPLKYIKNSIINAYSNPDSAAAMGKIEEAGKAAAKDSK